MTLKRAFSDQETDSGFDSGYSCEKDGTIKKVSVGNPFSRSDYTTDSSDAQFDVFSLPAALNVVEPSPLVGVLRKEDKKGSLPTNTDSYLEEEHAKRSLTVNPNVLTKVVSCIRPRCNGSLILSENTYFKFKKFYSKLDLPTR